MVNTVKYLEEALKSQNRLVLLMICQGSVIHVVFSRQYSVKVILSFSSMYFVKGDELFFEE